MLHLPLVNLHLTFECIVQHFQWAQDDIITNLNLSSEHLLEIDHQFNAQNVLYEVSRSIELIAPSSNPAQAVRYISKQDTLALEISEYLKKKNTYETRNTFD